MMKAQYAIDIIRYGNDTRRCTTRNKISSLMKSCIYFAVLHAFALGCPSGYSTWTDGRCFRAISSTFSYEEAAVGCASHGTRLVKIESDADNTAIYSVFKRDSVKSPYSFWLGLSCDGLAFEWSDGSTANYTNFADNCKCSVETIGSRYYIGHDMKWYEERDDMANHRVVCEAWERSVSPCDDYELLKVGDSSEICVKVHHVPLSWGDAETVCRSEDALLAIVKDREVNNFIRQLAIYYRLYDRVHIGLRMAFNGDLFWWGSYFGYEDWLTPDDYTNFAAGFPNLRLGECVSMDVRKKYGQWKNNDCDDVLLPFACTKPVFRPSDDEIVGSSKKKYGPGDKIYSPGYPQAPGVSEFEYLLEVPIGRLVLDIDFFELNECCDALIFYDGKSGTKLKQLSGYLAAPFTFRGVSNSLSLIWKAASGEHIRGFTATIRDEYD